MNNRYHLTISNCTFCASGPALLSRTIPALMSLTIDDRTITKVNTRQKRKDKTFISKMVKTLIKLETKYLSPRHSKKRQLFARKQKYRPIIPEELASKYNVLTAPEPGQLTVPKPFPHVAWNDLRIEPEPDLPTQRHAQSITALQPTNSMWTMTPLNFNLYRVPVNLKTLIQIPSFLWAKDHQESSVFTRSISREIIQSKLVQLAPET